MKVSLNHIRQFNKDENAGSDPAPDGVEALVKRIGSRLGAVEAVIPIGRKYGQGEFVPRIVIVQSCEAHPNADRLHVCRVDDGGQTKNVERDSDGYVQVVCGAANVRAGMRAVWLAPGVTVPDSALTAEPFVLEARPLRGVVSNGMLGSPHELGLGDNHDGILEIDDDTLVPGTPFAEAYGLRDDAVIDMENKMFTHRPDCFGVLGVARELAGIAGEPFKSPAWYRSDIQMETAEGALRVEVRNEIPEVVPRFAALPMSGVTVASSPVWLQVALSRMGVRPINNIVDLTNYYMLLTGQPLHAYDYDKVVAQDKGADSAALVIRYPKPGEQLLLLNGKTVTPRGKAIMIATRDTAIGLGGVMGGGDTEVSDTTQNIILECAAFDMYSIRRTSMEAGIFTDAVTRYTKGQTPLQNVAVIRKIAEDIQRLAGGRVAGKLVDDNHVPAEVQTRGSLEPPVTLTARFINDRLGLTLTPEDIARILRNVEFAVDIAGESLTVTAPFWRTDIAIAEDVVEEVGRLYGFDRLPLDLPRRDLTPAGRDPLLSFKDRLRRLLSRGGANEVLSYSFVHGNLLKKAGIDSAATYQLANALSPDLQYYRPSLTPSLLEKVRPNIRAGYDAFALFEVNKVHAKAFGADDDGLPLERTRLALIVTKADISGQTAADSAGAPYYMARHYLDYVLSALGIQAGYRSLAAKATGTPDILTQPFDPQRSAAVYVRGTDVLLGVVGEYRLGVGKALKLPARTAGLEVDAELLLAHAGRALRYTALPRFPKVERDICLSVPVATTWQTVNDFIRRSVPEILPEHISHACEPVDIYLPSDQTARRITTRVTLASFERTLTAEEVNGYFDDLAARAKTELNAERV